MWQRDRTRGSKIQIHKKDLVHRIYHVAVCMGNCILVFGGRHGTTPLSIYEPNDISLHEIIEYNCDSEKWYKHLLSPLKKAPPSDTCGTHGVCIDEAVYICGGEVYQDPSQTIGLWKLQRVQQTFEWSFEYFTDEQSDMPYCCSNHCVWGYDKKLWTFDGELADLEVTSFEPDSRVCQTLQCYGNVPSPRFNMAQTIYEENAWFYGGSSGGWLHRDRYDDLHQLNMTTLVWTRIQTVGPTTPGERYFHTFTALPKENKLILYGGCPQKESGQPWILDLSSLSWEKLEGSSDDGRQFHSATAVKSSIIIIGGEYDRKRCSNVFTIIHQPMSLENLALRTIHRKRNQIKPREWNMPSGCYNRLQAITDI